MVRDFIGRGWAFPIEPEPQPMSFLGGEEKIRQSIYLILATAPGERRMLPAFGCGVHDLVFEANTATLRTRVAERVRESLIRFEPRIDLLDVRVTSPPQIPNQLLIHIDYRIRANNAIYNMVYPFFLEEGAI